MTRGVELDADALMVRATVLTYRWIDELAEAAYRTMGSIASRAIGYLAPEVDLGGAIVSAGLIETDALDRDDVAGYLSELAEHNPELMDHVTSGGGGLLEGLQMRALLTASVLAGEHGRMASLGGLQAIGVDPMAPDFGSALRDSAGGFVTAPEAEADPPTAEQLDSAAPRGLEDLMATLSRSPGAVTVQQIAPHRYIAYLPGPADGRGRLRLVGGDHSAYAARVVAGIEQAVDGDTHARVMLVGSAQGGVTAAEVASSAHSDRVRHRPGRDRRRALVAGAPDPGPHPRPVARGPVRPGGAARLAHQRGGEQPADRGLRRLRRRRRGRLRRGRTRRRRGRPP